jgi:hypothetical protein
MALQACGRLHSTELLLSNDDEERFVTIDRWKSLTDFTRFQDCSDDQYRSLDTQLAGLAAGETKLGTFVSNCDPKRSPQRLD